MKSDVVAAHLRCHFSLAVGVCAHGIRCPLTTGPLLQQFQPISGFSAFMATPNAPPQVPPGLQKPSCKTWPQQPSVSVFETNPAKPGS